MSTEHALSDVLRTKVKSRCLKNKSKLPLGAMERQDVTTLPSCATIEQVMPMSGMTIEPSLLAPTRSPYDLFTKELCNFLAGVEIVRSGLGRSIAWLLTGMPIRGEQKKIGKG